MNEEERLCPRAKGSFLRGLWCCFAASVRLYRLQNVFSRNVGVEIEKSSCVYACVHVAETLPGNVDDKRKDLSTFDYRPAALNFISRSWIFEGRTRTEPVGLRISVENSWKICNLPKFFNFLNFCVSIRSFVKLFRFFPIEDLNVFFYSQLHTSAHKEKKKGKKGISFRTTQ